MSLGVNFRFPLAFFFGCRTSNSFSQKRIREIGIRKVFGATQLNIITLLNIHFLRWIAAAVILGISLSWIFLTNWMDSFACRQPVSIWIFILQLALQQEPDIVEADRFREAREAVCAKWRDLMRDTG